MKMPFGIFDKTPIASGPEDIPPNLLNQGIYRLHLDGDVSKFTSLAVEMFPKLAGRITCFGSDWLGRQFASDDLRKVKGEPQVLMLDAGAGEVLEVPASCKTFHEQELTDFPDAAVASNFFGAWKAAGGATPKYGQCVGYKTPLFLGGEDEISNLQVSDMETYWSLHGQLWQQVCGLQAGTKLGRVEIS